MTVVDAERLGQLLWNLAILTPKSGVTEGKALLWFNETKLQGYACDDFILIRDEVETDQADLNPFRLVAVDQLKEAERFVRDVPKGDKVTITFDDDGILLHPPTGPNINHVIETAPFEADPWEDLLEMLNQQIIQRGSRSRYLTWALNPARLNSIARMKTPGDNPIDFIQCTLNGFEDVATWAFRLGPTVTGIITPMDRDKLRQRGCTLWD